MNTLEHTFPLPEIEAHKLDEVKKELRRQPPVMRGTDFIRSHAWVKLTLICAVGVMAGSWLRNRH